MVAMDDQKDEKKRRLFSYIEISIIILLSLVPLFTSFPYRVNIFLSWEGAYRMSHGQVPNKDFGMPLGYMYWVIPTLFFKLFGAQLITLVKAQVFINIISGLAFRSILKGFSVHPGVRVLSILLYCISYSFFNFWPWYNHTVIVYEMVALAFLIHYLLVKKIWIWLALSALFTFFSFFTKQDGGSLAFILCLTLLLYEYVHKKDLGPLGIYLGSFLTVALLLILPSLKYNFGYWFNYGQAPHSSRISAFEIVDEFFVSSQWIKFYIFLIGLIVLAQFRNKTAFFSNRRNTLFLLLTLGILGEAAILQVTSYTPPDNNIFFHSFAFVFLLSFFADDLHLDYFKLRPLLLTGFGLLLWWSGVFWKYFQRVTERNLQDSTTLTRHGENVVNRHTYIIPQKDSLDTPAAEWTFTGLYSFEKIYMPRPTAEGIRRLLSSSLIKNGKNLRVLNMTELTPLAAEIPYQLEKGPDYPLWYHLGVAMFNKEAKMFEDKIKNQYYDLVLFEHLPSLNNFYPFRVRDSLLLHYQKWDSFPAPRRGNIQGTIEIFLPNPAR
jgi:hypothetical protein